MKLLVALSVLFVSANCQNLVLFGGVTDQFASLSSVEIVTPDGACQIGDMPFAGFGMSADYLADTQQVLICGGATEQGGDARSSCHIYDFASASWSDAPESLATGRLYHANAQLPDKIVIVGGESEGIPLSSAESISLGDLSVSAEADFVDLYEYSCASALDESTILVSGGLGNNIKQVTVFDGVAWESAEEMNFARYDHGCMPYTLDGRPGALVTGGMSTPLQTNIVEFYDFGTGQWERLEGNLPTPRFGHQMGSLGGVPTVVGGFFSTDTVQFEGYVWSANPDLALVNARSWFAIAEVPEDVAVCP